MNKGVAIAVAADEKEQILDGFDIGIELDDFERDLLRLSSQEEACLGGLPRRAALGKTFAFTEGIHLEVRADANNAFNHAGFGLLLSLPIIRLVAWWMQWIRCDCDRYVDDHGPV